MTVLEILLIGAWGGVTVMLAVVAFYLRLQLTKALIALQTVQLMAERPNVAMFAPEQVDNLASMLMSRFNGKKEYVQ